MGVTPGTTQGIPLPWVHSHRAVAPLACRGVGRSYIQAELFGAVPLPLGGSPAEKGPRDPRFVSLLPLSCWAPHWPTQAGGRWSLDTIHTAKGGERGGGSGGAPSRHRHQTLAPSSILGVETVAWYGRCSEARQHDLTIIGSFPASAVEADFASLGRASQMSWGCRPLPRPCEHTGLWAFHGNL